MKRETELRDATLPPLARSGLRALSVVVVQGRNVGRRYEIPGGGAVIGRDPKDATIPLHDAAVSSRHCAIELDADGAPILLDLGSRNGTFVNGEKVDERALREGDRIFVGDSVLEVTGDDELSQRFHRQIDELIHRDHLTGLLAKRAFDPELAHAFEVACRDAAPLVVLMMDMDGLKAINDGNGHQMGSFCIAEVGKIIQGALEGAGRACRFGGDEFVAFLPSHEIGAAIALCERIRARVEANRFKRNGLCVRATISIGAAERIADDTGPEDLVRRADEALYRAKRGGRNAVSR